MWEENQISLLMIPNRFTRYFVGCTHTPEHLRTEMHSTDLENIVTEDMKLHIEAVRGMQKEEGV